IRVKTGVDMLCRISEIEAGDPEAFSSQDIDPVRETRTFHHDELGRLVKSTQLNLSKYGQAVAGIDRYGEIPEERLYEHDELDRLVKMRFRSDGDPAGAHDETLGLWNMGHRNYMAGVLGRSVSRDPIGHSGGLNLYAYPTNPVTGVDPTGLEPSRGERARNFLVNQLAPLSEADQTLLAMALNEVFPKLLAQAGIDFKVEDLGPGTDGVTRNENGKVTLSVNSSLCEQDRALTTLHESRHALSQDKIQAEIRRFQETGGMYGNPPLMLWNDEIAAFRLELLMSLLITPVDQTNMSRTCRMFGTSVETQLRNSPYKPLYDEAQKVLNYQNSRMSIRDRLSA
ncbi:MAG: RHS repeat-associated core domain-containing protein, partial [Vulcanimicrobiota bacterium]